MPLASLHQLARQALAIFPGVLMANLSAALPQILAARLGDGAVSTMGYALRIHGAVTQALVMTVSTVLLPHFSGLVARHQWRELGEELQRIWYNVFWAGLMLPLSVGLVGLDMVHLVFGRGLFDTEAEMSVYRAWWWLSFALLPMLWGSVLAKLFQGLFRGGLLSWLALLGAMVLVVAGNLLGRILAVDGVAIAVALSYGSVAIACHFGLLRACRDCAGLKPALLKRTVWTAAAVTLLGGMAVWMFRYLKDAETFARVLLIVIPLAVGGYAVHRALSAGLERRVIG
jgi:putative peptidoglycan lipid II flippase